MLMENRLLCGILPEKGILAVFYFYISGNGHTKIQVIKQDNNLLDLREKFNFKLLFGLDCNTIDSSLDHNSWFEWSCLFPAL
jgi:hypothetical protein